jgi:hypothetical protein
MRKATGKFTITIPKGFDGYQENPTVENGGKIEREFEAEELETAEELSAYLNSGKEPRNILDLANAELTAKAKANAYQRAMAVYRPNELNEQETQNKLVMDFIRYGKMSEAQAIEKAKEILGLK